MKKSVCFVITMILFAISCNIFAAPAASQLKKTPGARSVQGYWQTLDDKTKQPSSVIHIRSQGKFHTGKIVKIYPVDGVVKKDYCQDCKGVDKNKLVLGLTIVKKMVCQGGECKGGTILDPRDGKVYRAKMILVDHGRWLKVRGYIGIPLFGQTVYWRHITKK